jgi:hypothetical protein
VSRTRRRRTNLASASIAAHASRFAPQLTLQLEAAPPAQGCAIPLEPPPRAALVAAALANTRVRTFIAEEVPTWTEERVRRNPPCYLVYEHRAVVGNLDDLPGMARHAEKRPGMGAQLGIRALHEHDEVLPYNIGLLRGPEHPRQFRYEQRMGVKSLLAIRDRKAVGEAMRRGQRKFLAWAKTQPRLDARIAETTGLTLIAFWQTVRGRNP